MSKPWIHSLSSVRRWGGLPTDYLPIHNFMDSSKGAIADNRHRVFFHNSFAIQPGGVLELIFGVTIKNSDGRDVCVRDIGEQHILEDFRQKFIPTPQDYLTCMQMQPWMNNAVAGMPDSCKGIAPPTKKTIVVAPNQKSN